MRKGTNKYKYFETKIITPTISNIEHSVYSILSFYHDIMSVWFSLYIYAQTY